MAASKTKRSKRLIYLLILAGLIIVGFAAYQKFSSAQNKHDFEQARKVEDQILADVRKQVGEPDNAEIESYCSRASQEFTQGGLKCHTNTKMVYAISSEDEANGIFKKIQSTATNSKLMPASKLSEGIKDYLVGDQSYHTASDTYRLSGLECTIGYTYNTPREIDLTIKDPSKNPFEITIGCYGPAKKQYYRLAS
jgi:hypothetical protein